MTCREGGEREDDEEEEEEEEARGTEAQCPAEVICLGSYRAYSHCWQSHMQTDTGEKRRCGNSMRSQQNHKCCGFTL